MFITPMIQILNLRKRYPNTVISYRDITIDHNSTLIVGKNGSGKSTLLKALLKFIQYEGVISPSIRYGYMPEKPQFPLDITIHTFLHTLLPNQTAEIRALIDRFELKSKEKEFLKNLSKGMMAKVNFIQAYLQPADVLILDEPLNGLDKDAFKTVMELLVNRQKPIIITTHLKDAFHLQEMDVIALD